MHAWRRAALALAGAAAVASAFRILTRPGLRSRRSPAPAAGSEGSWRELAGPDLT